jgi:hypothetical protein
VVETFKNDIFSSFVYTKDMCPSLLFLQVCQLMKAYFAVFVCYVCRYIPLFNYFTYISTYTSFIDRPFYVEKDQLVKFKQSVTFREIFASDGRLVKIISLFSSEMKSKGRLKK